MLKWYGNQNLEYKWHFERKHIFYIKTLLLNKNSNCKENAGVELVFILETEKLLKIAVLYKIQFNETGNNRIENVFTKSVTNANE